MNYSTAKQKIDTILKNSKVMYLATASKNGEPSIRQMCVIYLNGKLYFQTDSTFAKSKDLAENSAIALGIGAFSFKGTAKNLGAPKDNPEILEVFKQIHTEAYNTYSFLSTELLFEVELAECKIWDSKDKDFDTKETITTVNLKAETATTTFCV